MQRGVRVFCSRAAKRVQIFDIFSSAVTRLQRRAVAVRHAATRLQRRAVAVRHPDIFSSAA